MGLSCETSLTVSGCAGCETGVCMMPQMTMPSVRTSVPTTTMKNVLKTRPIQPVVPPRPNVFRRNALVLRPKRLEPGGVSDGEKACPWLRSLVRISGCIGMAPADDDIHEHDGGGNGKDDVGSIRGV